MKLLTGSEIDDLEIPTERVPARVMEDVIRLEDVSVEYRAPRERITSLKEYAIRLLQRRVQHDYFKALRNVSLNIREGEVYGIIGHNGAGKSTLLKIVSRVMKPTHGRVWVKGRVAPLLELGAGFHTELSGRENVFLNGTLLGFKHSEMEEMFESIVEFAEMGDFIDAPLRTYSTGMTVRLGFAVATAIKPDILIVDEVLAVGDEQFRDKCAARMDEYRNSGTTILLVTHDSKLVRRICTRAAWIDHGELQEVGDPEAVIDRYHLAYHKLSGKTGGKSPAPAETAQIPELEREVLERTWSYSIELPSGGEVSSKQPAEIIESHRTRMEMMFSALDPLYGERWGATTCLDLGCGQGAYSIALARLGCRRVQGIDSRQEVVEDADLVRRLYGLTNLSFTRSDLFKIDPESYGPFDVVLMFGLLDQVENPLGALRLARDLAGRTLLIDTEVIPPIDGGRELFRLTEADPGLRPASSGLSFRTDRETLVRILERFGFSRIEIAAVPEGGSEFYASGKRIMLVCHR